MSQTIEHWIDGRYPIQVNLEDIEIAKILLQEKKKMEVIKEFIANGFKPIYSIAVISEALREG